MRAVVQRVRHHSHGAAVAEAELGAGVQQDFRTSLGTAEHAAVGHDSDDGELRGELVAVEFDMTLEMVDHAWPRRQQCLPGGGSGQDDGEE